MNILSGKYGAAWLAVIFILVNVFLYHLNGPRVVTDSLRYLEYASGLKNGFYFDPHNFWYLGYVVYCLVCDVVTGGTWGIIVGQYIMAFAGVMALFGTTLNVSNSRNAAFITASLFVIFPGVSQWNSYVLPESIYFSGICISLYAMSEAYRRKSIKFTWLAILAVISTALIKPTGFVLPLAALTALLFEMWNRPAWRYRCFLVTGALLMVLILFLNTALATFQVMENYRKGEIIYNISTATGVKGGDWLIIDPPPDISLDRGNGQPLWSMASFWFDYPVYSLKLFLAKVFYFFSHVRPYWSWQHNLFVIVFLLPVYFFFWKGLASLAVNVKAFALSFVMLHAISIGLTSEDWDGRFLMAAMPVILSVAVHGVPALRSAKAEAMKRN